jgi:hypothetical protein
MQVFNYEIWNHTIVSSFCIILLHMMWKIATDKTNFILFRQHTRFKRNTLEYQLFGLHENL